MTNTPTRLRSDFADWLSPILVKELRQGMRARAFITSFLLLQGLMLFMAIMGLVTAAHHEDTSEMSAVFWTMVGVPVLFIMPMAGLTAVSRELKANTLELVFLTRLTARRIIAGKWLALVSQIALLVCAVLPYAVLRYFLGGVNISSELAVLGWMLLASALFTGATVGISPYQSRLMRVFLTLGLVGGMQILGLGGLSFGFRSGSRHMVMSGSSGVSSAPGFVWFIAIILVAVITLLLMLEVGATRIAPPAENHSWLKRILTIAALLLPLLFMRDTAGRIGFAVGALLLVTPFFVGALCEEPRFIPSLFRPFARSGALARVFGRLLYPGWQSGLLFVLVALAIALLMLSQTGTMLFPSRAATVVPGVTDEGAAHRTVWFLAWSGAVLMPAAFVRGLFPKTRRAMALYWVVQVACIVLFALITMHDNVARVKWIGNICVLPTCMVMFEMFGDNSSQWTLLLDPASRAMMMLIVTALSVLVLAIRSIPLWRKIRECEVLAAQQKTPAESDAAPRANPAAAA